MPRISGVHACLSDLSGSAAKTAESRDRTDILAAPAGAILVEGCDAATVVDAMNALKAVFDLPSGAMQIGMYRLEHTLHAVHR
jgi:hypothetical protein